MGLLDVGEEHSPETLIGFAKNLSAFLTGISFIKVSANASNSWVKCLLRPAHGGVTR